MRQRQHTQTRRVLRHVFIYALLLLFAILTLARWHGASPHR